MYQSYAIHSQPIDSYIRSKQLVHISLKYLQTKYCYVDDDQTRPICDFGLVLIYGANPLVYDHNSRYCQQCQEAIWIVPFNFYNQSTTMRTYVIALLVVVVLSANKTNFCWKDSYGRGVGIVPNACSSDEDRLGLLCYKKCPAGFNRPAGLDCYSICPAGFTDTGLYCMINEATYGRGVGYPWKFGDGPNSDGMYARCQADHGKGKCEQYGLIVYPKCRPGYTNSECCICAANFNCTSFGFWSNVQTAYSCFKNRIAVGAASSPGCPSGYENQAGLCYKKCAAGYYGVGPVCWANVISGWVDCGMGAATTPLTCANTIFTQVSSVFMLVANLASFGTTVEATAALKASDPKYIQKINDMLNKIMNIYHKSQDVIVFFNDLAKAGSGAEIAKEFIDLMKRDNVKPEDIVRIIAEVIELFDPLGISDVVAAYNYPLCSKIK